MTSTSKSEKVFNMKKKAFKKSRKYAVSDNYNYSYVIIQVKGVIKHNQSNKSNSKSPNTLDGLKGSASI